MVSVKDLTELIKVTLFSAYIEGEKPISVMLISDRPEAGKSELLKLFSSNPGVVYLTDITAFSLWRDFRKEIESGEIKYLLFPEFQTPLAKAKPTRDSFIQAINDLTETGATDVHSGFLPRPLRLKSPRVIGVICCFPRSIYGKEKARWLRSGFLSRFLIATYSYSDEVIEEIKQSIIREEYLHNTLIRLKFPQQEMRVRIPRKIDALGRVLEESITDDLVKKRFAYGFRTLKIIRRLMKASALEQGRDKVASWDYRRVKKLSYLFSEEFRQVEKR